MQSHDSVVELEQPKEKAPDSGYSEYTFFSVIASHKPPECLRNGMFCGNGDFKVRAERGCSGEAVASANGSDGRWCSHLFFHKLLLQSPRSWLRARRCEPGP